MDRRVNALMMNQSWAIEKIATLTKTANENKKRRFKDLYKTVRNKDVLRTAYLKIASNTGSKTGGVDGMTKLDLMNPVVQNEILNELSDELTDGGYHPLPVRRVEIPKNNGKGRRPLGIPALKDRIVQSAVKMVLEALYEPIFHETSHGFRPRRSCQTAVSDIIPRKYDWVIEGDIKGCFDNIKHGKLLDILRKRVSDEKFINLILKFLKSGYQMGYGVDGELPIFETENGTPQGGIVSPVLANIYLHEFDSFMEKHLKNIDVHEIEVAKERSYLQNKISKLNKALKIGRANYAVKIRWDFKEIPQYTFESEEEILSAIEEAMKSREGMGSKTKPYKTLTAVIRKLRETYNEGKYPVSFSYNLDGSSTNGERVVLNNRFEMQKMLRTLVKMRKHVNTYNEKDYFNHKSLGYVRYADDFVILLGNLTKEDAKKFKEEIKEWFGENLGLTLSPEKTLITHATEGFRFLGYDIVKRPKQLEGKTLGYETFSKVYIPKEKVNKVKNKIEKVIRAHHNLPLADLIKVLNSIILGWSNFYKICNNLNTTAGTLDKWLWWKVMKHRARKHKSTVKEMYKKYMEIKFEMWGLKRNRIADVVEGRIVPLRMFSDMSYVTPKEIADQIKNKAKTENWYFVELDDKEIKQQIARTNHGYSYSNFVELEATQGRKCSQCGSKDELLEVHHLRKVNRNKRINSDAIKQASMNLPKVLLCKKCHSKINPITNS